MRNEENDEKLIKKEIDEITKKIYSLLIENKDFVDIDKYLKEIIDIEKYVKDISKINSINFSSKEKTYVKEMIMILNNIFFNLERKDIKALNLPKEIMDKYEQVVNGKYIVPNLESKGQFALVKYNFQTFEKSKDYLYGPECDINNELELCYERNALSCIGNNVVVFFELNEIIKILNQEVSNNDNIVQLEKKLNTVESIKKLIDYFILNISSWESYGLKRHRLLNKLNKVDHEKTSWTCLYKTMPIKFIEYELLEKATNDMGDYMEKYDVEEGFTPANWFYLNHYIRRQKEKLKSPTDRNCKFENYKYFRQFNLLNLRGYCHRDIHNDFSYFNYRTVDNDIFKKFYVDLDNVDMLFASFIRVPSLVKIRELFSLSQNEDNKKFIECNSLDEMKEIIKKCEYAYPEDLKYISDIIKSKYTDEIYFNNENVPNLVKILLFGTNKTINDLLDFYNLLIRHISESDSLLNVISKSTYLPYCVFIDLAKKMRFEKNSQINDYNIDKIIEKYYEILDMASIDFNINNMDKIEDKFIKYINDSYYEKYSEIKIRELNNCKLELEEIYFNIKKSILASYLKNSKETADDNDKPKQLKKY